LARLLPSPESRWKVTGIGVCSPVRAAEEAPAKTKATRAKSAPVATNAGRNRGRGGKTNQVIAMLAALPEGVPRWSPT